MKRAIRNRVLFAALLPAGLVAALLGSMFLASRLDDLDVTLRMRAWAVAREVASLADFAIFADDRDALRKLAQTALAEPDVRAVTIADMAGQVLTSAGHPAVPAPPRFDGHSREFSAAGQAVSVVVFPVIRARLELDDVYLGAVADPAKAKQTEAVGQVLVEMSRDGLTTEKRRLVLVGFVITAVGLVLGALLALRIARAVTRPILHIGEVVERIGRGELDARVSPDADHTLRRLEQGVNGMASRIATAHDLLEEKVREATAHLRRSEERLSLVISGTSDGIWDWDLKRGEIYFSRRFRELLGYGDSEEFHRDFPFFTAALHPEDAERTLAAQADHLKSGDPYDVEFRLRCRDGGYRWFRGRGQALWDASGNPHRFAGSITDITAQKEAEEALRRRKDEAEQATVAKTRFLAAASHDLRQPMHALGMFVSRLNKYPHAAEVAELVANIETSVFALQDLLDALLDISKLDAGALTPKLRIFPADELLLRMESEYRAGAEERGLRLRHRASPLWLHTDPVLLERILMNLVVNAIRYTDHGGVLIACRRRGERVRLEVRDSGIGIPEASQQEIFKEFVQLDNPERDRAKGLGLGLTICSRLAHLLDHPFGVRSAPGRGSVFWIEVPLAQASAAVAPTPAPPLPDARLEGVTVAIVDDDANARSGTGSLLESWGCRVVAAESRVELLRLCESLEQPPRIALCDYRLRHGETGILVVAALRARYGGTFPCVLVSGDTDASVMREATERGLPFLHKPVRPAKLRTLMQRLLASSGH